jgi:hypothetical protein
MLYSIQKSQPGQNELPEGTVTKLDAGDLLQLLGRFNRPGLPKYMALHDAVLHAVASGQLAPGTRMPNEQELAEVLPLSLGTDPARPAPARR